MTKHKRYDAAFKAKVALEAAKGERTLSELSGRYGVHSTVISKWKGELLGRAKEIFETPAKKSATSSKTDPSVKDLHTKIGELTVEKDFLSDKLRHYLES